MLIPPITLYEEDQAVIEILKALAEKGAALTAYTGAATKKIQVLLEYLENQRSPAMTAGELAESIHGSAVSLDNVRYIQAMLDSNLAYALNHLGAEELCRLVTLPPGKSCRLKAQGQGLVKNGEDAFYSGTAKLKEIVLAADGAAGIGGRVKYRVEKNGQFEELEAVSTDMRLAFVNPIQRRACPSRPNIAWISGYGIVKRSTNTAEWVRGIAWFALTLWDLGGRKKQGKFRMAVCSPHQPSFNHDSGIVTQ
ncbi:MAG: hypothetical protein P4N59_07635 [Negativicutes bacterium]|nr:hypothetical protein [Negativicutes bacterium]